MFPDATSIFKADGELYQYDRNADDIKLITSDGFLIFIRQMPLSTL
jgi:hypothetical protein